MFLKEEPDFSVISKFSTTQNKQVKEVKKSI